MYHLLIGFLEPGTSCVERAFLDHFQYTLLSNSSQISHF